MYKRSLMPYQPTSVVVSIYGSERGLPRPNGRIDFVRKEPLPDIRYNILIRLPYPRARQWILPAGRGSPL